MSFSDFSDAQRAELGELAGDVIAAVTDLLALIHSLSTGALPRNETLDVLATMKRLGERWGLPEPEFVERWGLALRESGNSDPSFPATPPVDEG